MQLAPSGAAPAFDPATLALTGWWRANYTASPWVANASAGASGTNGNLTEATNPPTAGTAINSLTPAAFVTNKELSSANNVIVFGGTTKFHASFLAIQNTASASSVGSAYLEASVFTDDVNAFIQCSFSTRGYTFSMYDGAAAYHEVNVACATGALHLVHVWWDGANLHAKIDSAAEATPVACASFFGAATALKVGRNYTSTKFLDGSIADLMLSDVDLGATARDNIRLYCNSRYALSL